MGAHALVAELPRLLHRLNGNSIRSLSMARFLVGRPDTPAGFVGPWSTAASIVTDSPPSLGSAGYRRQPYNPAAPTLLPASPNSPVVVATFGQHGRDRSAFQTAWMWRARHLDRTVYQTPCLPMASNREPRGPRLQPVMAGVGRVSSICCPREALSRPKADSRAPLQYLDNIRAMLQFHRGLNPKAGTLRVLISLLPFSRRLAVGWCRTQLTIRG